MLYRNQMAPCDKDCQDECWEECIHEHKTTTGGPVAECVIDCVKAWGGWPEGQQVPSRIRAPLPTPRPIPVPRPMPRAVAQFGRVQAAMPRGMATLARPTVRNNPLPLLALFPQLLSAGKVARAQIPHLPPELQ